MGGDDTENLLSGGGLDLSSFIVAKDGDGDTIGLADGAFKVQVFDDIPTIVAREAGTELETISFSLSGVSGGNDLYKVLNGDGDFDLLLSGRTGNAADTVNTSNDIGVGQGQNINGGGDEEYLRIDFVKAGVATGNNMATTYTAAEHYAVKAFTFTTPQVQQGPATIFLQLFSVPPTQDNSSASANFGDNAFVGIQDVKVNNVSVAFVPVYEADGVTLKGYLVSGVDAGETIEVTGVSDYGRIVIGNLDGVTVNTGGANTVVVNGATSFSVLAGSASVTVAETFKIRHDESAGVNDTPDPNDADDTGDRPAGDHRRSRSARICKVLSQCPDPVQQPVGGRRRGRDLCLCNHGCRRQSAR